MELPNYFLVDLPSEAPLTGPLITEGCLTLRRNRESYLRSRSTSDMIDLLCRVAHGWREENDPFRQAALEACPHQTGFTAPVLAEGLDAFFATFTPDSLEAVIRQDLGSLERLDQFVASDAEQNSHRASLGLAPPLLFHITAGNLPVPALMSIAWGLLLRSAQFVKCASGGSVVPRLFAHSVYAVEPKVASCIELAEWPGGNSQLEDAVLAHADCVTATGSDETLDRIRRRLPRRIRFLPFGHRLSFGYVTREVLASYAIEEAAAKAAADVAAWDQQGCLSPHVLYVETSGATSPENFAELLSGQLAELEKRLPRAPLSVEESAVIASRRSMYELRRAHTPGTLLWRSADSTAWTVVYEADPLFQRSCLNRFIYVKPVENVEEALYAIGSEADHLSTVGLAARGGRLKELVQLFAHAGLTRVCPLGQMQKPPLTWRHDGRPALGDLVTWCDWER